MKTIDSLKLLNAWVDPELPIQAARMLLNGYKANALPVSEGGFLLGIITAAAVAAAQEDDKVRTHMAAPGAIIQSGTPIREVANIFLEQQLEYAPVVEDDRSIGIVTARMLLSELSRSFDPLTELSWSDLLREWGVQNLKNSREVTILFIDLDDFGQYNKRFGHIIGDKVLKMVSEMVQGEIDPDRDILVRYGGDEFAIGTLRHREEAEERAERLERMQSELIISEAENTTVRFSVGVFGGKRTKERENSHFSATLDNLINLASKAALAHKQAKKAAEEEARKEAAAQEAPTPQAGPEATAVQPTQPASVSPATVVNRNARLVEVLVDENAPNSMTTVILSLGEGVTSGVSARMGGSVSMSVAQATAKALERAYPGIGIRVEDVHLMNGRETERIASVRLQITDANGVRTGSGAITVREDVYFTVAGATLEAFYGPA